MDEFKKRVTKNDKKHKHRVYSQKHVRNVLKQKEGSISNGTLYTPTNPLLPDGRVGV